MLFYSLNIALSFFHRLLTSESGIVQPFLVNESGFISSRRVLPVAWSVGVLVVGAALLGTPNTAKADPYCGTLLNCPYGPNSASTCTSRCINVMGCPDSVCDYGDNRCHCYWY